jgi:hypothetical protein
MIAFPYTRNHIHYFFYFYRWFNPNLVSKSYYKPKITSR